MLPSSCASYLGATPQHGEAVQANQLDRLWPLVWAVVLSSSSTEAVAGVAEDIAVVLIIRALVPV